MLGVSHRVTKCSTDWTRFWEGLKCGLYLPEEYARESCVHLQNGAKLNSPPNPLPRTLQKALQVLLGVVAVSFKPCRTSGTRWFQLTSPVLFLQTKFATPLLLAASGGHKEVVEVLIAHGASASDEDSVSHASLTAVIRAVLSCSFVSCNQIALQASSETQGRSSGRRETGASGTGGERGEKEKRSLLPFSFSIRPPPPPPSYSPRPSFPPAPRSTPGFPRMPCKLQQQVDRCGRVSLHSDNTPTLSAQTCNFTLLPSCKKKYLVLPQLQVI